MNLGDLQQLTMLAVARLGEDAFGAQLQEELRQTAGREVSVSTIYVTLVRLEDQGLVRSDRLDPDPDKGGRGRRIFTVTEKGWKALRHSRDALAGMWQGLEPA